MTPRPYQLEGRDFLAARRYALLADQMRVGKTPQAIMACDRVGAERILILTPAIGTYQWAMQWQDWSNRAPAVILDSDGGSFSDFKGVLVSSYNRALTNLPALLAPPKWDVFIPDEAHFAKTPTAKRTSMVYGRRGIGWNAERLWALTGTPAPNHAAEMWAMLRAFGAVKMTYEEFAYYYCIYNQAKGRFHGNQKKHLPELLELVKPFTLRRTLREVAPSMPRIGYNFYVVKPETTADLGSDIEDQIAEKNRIEVAMAKVPALAQEIQDNLEAGEYTQTVVFGYHVEPLKALVGTLLERGVEAASLTGSTPAGKRRNIQDAFRLGVLPVLVGQILAAGMAIDLSAAQHGYFLELDYVPASNQQAAHRLVNIQTQDPVTFDVLTWPNTMDDRVQRRIVQKLNTAVFAS